MSNEQQEEILERQKYALNYYEDTIKTKLWIRGLNPVGVEIGSFFFFFLTKQVNNLILMGFSEIFLSGEGKVDYLDLSSPFYDEEDLQLEKTKVAHKKLQNLKKNCKLTIVTTEINEKTLSELKIEVKKRQKK